MLRSFGLAATLALCGCFEDVDPPPIEDDGDTDEASTGDASTGEMPPVCGDGAMNGDELCDDANEIDGDGCTQCVPSGTVLWSKLEGSAGSMDTEAGSDIAVDAEGRVFVTGTVVGGNSPDIWVRAFDGADGATLWTATEHRGDDFGAAVIADGEGGAFVAGTLGGGMLGALNPWIAHFDANGVATFETIADVPMGWGAAVGIASLDDTLLTSGFRLDGIAANAVVQEFDDAGTATGREFVVDVGLADYGWRIVSSGSKVRATAFMSAEAIVAGWNRGFELEPTWYASIPGAVQSGAFGAMEGLQPLSLAMTGDGTTFACATVAAGENANMQLSRLNAAGEIQWSQQHEAGATDICGGVAVDGAGNVLLVGTTADDAGESIAVAKYTASAELVWETTIEGDNGAANGVEIAVGPGDSVFITGAMGSADDRDVYVARLVP